MPWYNNTNFPKKGGDRLKAMVTPKEVMLGVSWRLIVGIEERMSESMPSKQLAAV